MCSSFKMVSISLFERIKKQEKRLRNRKTFNKFHASNIGIFLSYKQNFKLSRCELERCGCFKITKVQFQKNNPLLYTEKTKRNIQRLIRLNERHFNTAKIKLNHFGECVKRSVIKKGVKHHLETLRNFKSLINNQNKDSDYTRYLNYIQSEICRCEEFSDEIVPWQYKEYVPGIIHLVSLHAHYHTLRLFQSFIMLYN